MATFATFKRLKDKGVALGVVIFVAAFYVLEVRMDMISNLGLSMTVLTPIIMIFFLLIEMPVAYSLGATAFYFILVQGNMPLMLMPRSFTHGADSAELLLVRLAADGRQGTAA